jgi:hypothetical protein
MAGEWAEAMQGVKWLGWCVAQRAQASGSVGRLQEEGCQHILSHASTATAVNVGNDEIGGCGPLFAGCQQRTRA